MAPKNIFQIEDEMLQELRQGYCSYPKLAGDECSPGVSKAHTVQRRGGLTAIAEDSHVLTVKPSMKGMIEHEGLPPPRRIGLKQASVFPGFCNKHDAEIFKRIEGKHIELDKLSAMLFAYRAIAYERFSKEAQLRITDIQRDSDRGAPLWKQELIQNHLHAVRWGIEIGIADVEAWKSDYDSRIVSGNLDNFHFHAVRFDQVLPFVGCCAFYPEFDLQGNELQRLARRGFKFEHLTLSITSFSDQTVAFFGWIGASDGPAANFVKSYAVLPQDRKANAMLRIAFEQSDNIYFQESWWKALSDEAREKLQLQILNGTPATPKTSNGLVDDGSTYVSANVLETTT